MNKTIWDIMKAFLNKYFLYIYVVGAIVMWGGYFINVWISIVGSIIVLISAGRYKTEVK